MNIQNLWNFEMRSQESMHLPMMISKGFQQRNRQQSQKLNNDIFCRLPFTNDQCITGTENYPDAGIFLTYDDDDYAQG